jgi:hypothetical protein
MKSLRVWFSGLALGAALLFFVPTAKAQVPNGFTYEGVLEDNGVPLAGAQNVIFSITLSDINGTTLYIETMQNVEVSNGIFSLVVGGPSAPFTGMDFNQQYFMTVVVTDVNGTITLADQALESAPYAINAGTVNGLQASETPIAGDLFPVPIGTGYSGLAKIDPAFLPSIPNSLLSLPLVIGNTSANSVSLTAQNIGTNGNEALLVNGGIGANNATGAADGTGLSSGSPQTYWADQVSIASGTGTSLQIYNTLVDSKSTIVITPVEPAVSGDQFMITAQNAGTFTVSSTGSMGGGAVTGLNYLVINH